MPRLRQYEVQQVKTDDSEQLNTVIRPWRDRLEALNPGDRYIEVDEVKVDVFELYYDEEKKEECDCFYQDFLSHREDYETEVWLNGKNLGVQGADYVDIQLPDHLLPQGSDKLSPVFILPGIRGSHYSVASLIREAYFQGRRVVCLGYPESSTGTLTVEYAQELEKTRDLSVQAEYYKNVLRDLTTDQDFELWGYSTGGAVITQILSDPEMQQRINNAVLLAPAAAVQQSVESLILGARKEFQYLSPSELLINLQNLTYLGGDVLEIINNTMDFHNQRLENMREPNGEQEELKKRVFKALREILSKKSKYWSKMRVGGDGGIIIVSGEEDKLTKTHQSLLLLKKSCPDRVQIITVNGGSHFCPLIKAREIVGKIALMQADMTSIHSHI